MKHTHMKRQTLLIICALFLAQLNVFSQTSYQPSHKVDLGVSIGSDGCGIDVSTPINDILSLRAGLTFLPYFQVPVSFTFDSGKQEETEGEEPQTTEKMIETLRNITGLEIDDKVTMIATPAWKSARVLLDVMPLENKHLHFTGGLYLSPSTVAKIANAPEDASTLTSVCIYNYLYDQSIDDQPLISMGDFDLYSPAIQDRIISYGRIGVPIGTRKADGKDYILYPTKDATVTAKVKVPIVKPYLGAGYSGYLIPGNTDFSFSVDGGLMFLFKSPSVVMHDGTDIIHDLNEWNGRLQPICKTLRNLYAYPVVSFRISHKLF